ncbi:glycoside hydrolase family 15 protein [Streptomyces racemochromogenes]|uniref:Glycoside hydrolase family 15 protein n=1 Tax=Streptomyces racemochromogenes TaxID=67353 RepID=A0ABW7PLQ8_9ACTN
MGPTDRRSTGPRPGLRHVPRPLRDYTLLADGERGALTGPDGDVVWLCVPGWDGPAVFSELIGGAGAFTVCPEHSWKVSGGAYAEGSLIWTARWTLPGGVVECREALAAPAEAHRVVLLRRVRAVTGAARVTVRLSARGEYGTAPAPVMRRAGEELWEGARGPLRVRLRGPAAARNGPDGELTAVVELAEGGVCDLVLEIGDRPLGAPADAGAAWRRTEEFWAGAVPGCSGLAAARDVRHAYAVLTGLTCPRTGAMVAAATTSLPEHADADRDYDYRYAWLRDQCYAGQAVAVHGPHPLTDAAVRVVTERVLADGPGLRPAYRTDGSPVPPERRLPLCGYPGAADRIGNRAGSQFQLDTFGEVLELLAAAARHDRLPDDGVRAAMVAGKALEEHWDRPDAGLWELDTAWWTHSRLAAVTGLRAAAREIGGPAAGRWSGLAETVLRETRRRCLHPSGRWQRSASDPGTDAALLRPLASPYRPGPRAVAVATREAVERELAVDGFVYRFRHGDGPLGEAEGAFLLGGFLMSSACLAHGRPVAAARWFERTRTAVGQAGLFAEEYDVRNRQLRGNLPQAFVHALLLESAVRLDRAAG